MKYCVRIVVFLSVAPLMLEGFVGTNLASSGMHLPSYASCMPRGALAAGPSCMDWRGLPPRVAKNTKSSDVISMSSRSSSRSSSKGDSAIVLRETGSSPGGELNVANIVEQQKIQNLREDLAKDTESNSKQGTATYSEPETVVSDMTFEEWKMVFGDVGISPNKLKSVFDQLDSDKNGRVSMNEFINGLDGFTGGTVHPLAVKGVLQSVRLKMLDRIQELVNRNRRRNKIKKLSGFRMYTNYLKDKWNDKEESRKYRRTIFTHEDWKRFRTSGTSIFHNLQTMFNSRIIQGLWMEVACVALVGLVVSIINAAILSGLLQCTLSVICGAIAGIPFCPACPKWLCFAAIPSDGSFLFALPPLPFQLSAPALGLLLVFRTNTAYARWNEARGAWSKIENHAINLSRQGLAYLHPTEKEEHVRRVLCLAHCLLAHFRLEEEEGARERLSDTLTQLVGKNDAERLLKAQILPVQAMSDISKLVRTSLSDRLDGSTKARFDLHLDELTNALIVCDRLKKMPVPLIYTRHTGRFLGLWVLLLPLALASDMGGSFVVVPVCSVVSMLFFGIEELGVQIEEPFSILPLEDYVASIESAASQMLANEVEFENSEGAQMFPGIGRDAVPMSQYMTVYIPPSRPFKGD